MAWSDIATIQVPQSKVNSPSSAWMNAAVADQAYKKKFHGCKITKSSTVVVTIPSAPTNVYQPMPVDTVVFDTDSYAHSSTGIIIPSGLAGLYLISYHAEFGPLNFPVRTTIGLNGVTGFPLRGLGNTVAQTLRPNFNGDWQPTQLRYSIVLPLNAGDVLELYAQLIELSAGSAAYSAELEVAFLGFTHNTGHTYTRLRNINNPTDFSKAPATWGNQVRENTIFQSEAVGFTRELLFRPYLSQFTSDPTEQAIIETAGNPFPDWEENTVVGAEIPPTTNTTNWWGLDWDPYNIMPVGQQAMVIPAPYAGAWLINSHVQWSPRDASMPLETQTWFATGIATNNGSGWGYALGREEIGADQTPLFAPTSYSSDIILVTPGMQIMPYSYFRAPVGVQRGVSAMYVTAAWLGAEAS